MLARGFSRVAFVGYRSGNHWDVAGGRLATGHLIGLGHRRIGFVGDMTFAKPLAGLGFTSSAERLRARREELPLELVARASTARLSG